MRKIVASLLALSYLFLFTVEIGGNGNDLLQIGQHSGDILTANLTDGCDIACCSCPVSVAAQAIMDKSNADTLFQFGSLAANSAILKSNALPVRLELNKVNIPSKTRFLNIRPVYIRIQSFLI